MKPVQACSICGGAIVGFGNDAQPINDGRCCDQCNAERIIPAQRMRVAAAKNRPLFPKTVGVRPAGARAAAIASAEGPRPRAS